MARADLVLLHAPSVYDFRESSIMFGPVSDMVPSTPVFEMYPIGLTTIAEHLERHGLSVRIVNLAVRMLRDPRFDVERAVAGMQAALFGIDLHWLPHAHGAVEVARIVKRLHPDSIVVLGGLTASFYHEELMEYGCVDAVMRGDSTEEPMRQLVEAVRGGGCMADVPNLTWKDSTGAVHVNPLSWVPRDFNDVSLDYSYNMKAAVRHRDLVSLLPFKDWLAYPACAALTSRGCAHDCVTCGGSAYAFRTHFGRSRPAFRDPERVAADIAHIQRYIPGPVFVLNDPLQAGMQYAEDLVRAIGRLDLPNPVAFEFFKPPPEGWWEFVGAHIRDWSAEISMESHDDEVRAAFGRRYAAEELERSIRRAFECGCRRFDVYFMTGLPQQTAASVRETPEYVRHLYDVAGPFRHRLLAFISPMAPTLDPGSRVFDDPERYGYALRARSLEEHRRLLVQPSWKHILNYETRWMSRDEQVEATYEAALGVTRAKVEAGAVPREEGEATAERIGRARRVMALIDQVMESDPVLRSSRLRALKEEFDSVSESTVCDKRELAWQWRARPAMVFNVLALWARETFM
ncbi:MAG: hypothetical protein Kow0056_06480 [Coriobacteriia bacterium]